MPLSLHNVHKLRVTTIFEESNFKSPQFSGFKMFCFVGNTALRNVFRGNKNNFKSENSQKVVSCNFITISVSVTSSLKKTLHVIVNVRK